MIYIDRDNTVKIELLLNNRKLGRGGGNQVISSITRAVVYIEEDNVTLDSDIDPELSLTDQETAILITYGEKLNLTPGTYSCKLTCYDINHPNGVAWASFRLRIEQWTP